MCIYDFTALLVKNAVHLEIRVSRGCGKRRISIEGFEQIHGAGKTPRIGARKVRDGALKGTKWDRLLVI